MTEETMKTIDNVVVFITNAPWVFFVGLCVGHGVHQAYIVRKQS